MANEGGKEYNPETAQHLRPKRFDFVTCGETFSYELQIPQYILDRLNSEILDRLYGYMHGYTTRVVTDAIRGGYLTTDAGRAAMRKDVGQHLRNYLWERFSITQEQKGYDAWQVAPSLQEVPTL